MRSVRAACRSLLILGIGAGWGLFILGILAELREVDLATADKLTRAQWTRALFDAGVHVIPYALAGWFAFVLSRVTASVILAHLESAASVSQVLPTEAARAVALLEKIVEALEHRTESGGIGDDRQLGRARSLAEIEQLIRGAHWIDAEKSLQEFEIEFPGDPRSGVLREELAAARQGSIREGLAQLDAARNANNPERVLELYHVVAPSLADDLRGPLANDLASWFLNLIHRRLRTGKIQADVVWLAARFAESFATTVQGASVHAALPTLRRSVGLCPRCAQPYLGIAEACPQCLGRATNPPAVDAANAESTAPDRASSD